MKIKINNNEVECKSTILSKLLSELNLPTDGIAIAINNTIAPHEKWNQLSINEGDNILIIKAVCGG